jgi:hypothetical protein
MEVVNHKKLFLARPAQASIPPTSADEVARKHGNVVAGAPQPDGIYAP